MDEELFNIQIRKFLKNVGVTAQRQIESSIREAYASGQLNDKSIVSAKCTLEIQELHLKTEIRGEIKLS